MSRTQALLVKLHEKQALVSTYMNYHDTELSQDRDNVRARTVANVDKDLLTFSGEVHDAATTLKLRHPFAPPANGTGPTIRPPLFMRLTSLVVKDNAQSLVGRMDIGLKTSTASTRGNTRMTGKKRKAVAVGQPSGATSTSHPRLTSAPQQPPARSTFAQSILYRQTPSDVCAHAWKGEQCERLANNRACNYDHNRRHLTTQQLPSGSPPPPLGPPPSRPPTRPHQPHRLHPLSPPAAPMQDSSRRASSPDTAEEDEAAPGGTDDAGPAPQRGRPERGEARDLRFPCLQMRANLWVWQERPYQGHSHRTCSSVRKAILEAKKGWTSW